MFSFSYIAIIQLVYTFTWLIQFNIFLFSHIIKKSLIKIIFNTKEKISRVF